jgi:hypothetical protein
MTDNLLDPLVFDSVKVQRFVREYRCALCGSYLAQYPAPDHKWYVKCPEHDYAMKHTVVKVRTLEEVAYNTRKAEREMNPLTEEQKKHILESLGF